MKISPRNRPDGNIMTSTRRQAANRRNAQKSTGPTSERGKATSSLNALRHGLSAQSVHDAETNAWIDALAKELLGMSEGDDAAIHLARDAAEAEVQLQRIWSLKQQLWVDDDLRQTIEGSSKLVRYERQFSNRRDRALRALTD